MDASVAPNHGRYEGFTALRFQVQSGPAVMVNYRRLRILQNTWISLATKDAGWGYYYTREQGYGAYEQSIVVPFSKASDPSRFNWGYNRKKFDPDVTAPNDIVLIRSAPEPVGPRTSFTPIFVTGSLNRTFEVQSLSGGGASYGVSGQVFSIRIRDPHTKDTATYTYTGLGAGAGFGIMTPSGWTKVTVEPSQHGGQLKLPIGVKDFEGSGNVTSLGVGRSGSSFIFDSVGARMVLEGWDVQVGGQADFVGYWHLRS